MAARLNSPVRKSIVAARSSRISTALRSSISARRVSLTSVSCRVRSSIRSSSVALARASSTRACSPRRWLSSRSAAIRLTASARSSSSSSPVTRTSPVELAARDLGGAVDHPRQRPGDARRQPLAEQRRQQDRKNERDAAGDPDPRELGLDLVGAHVDADQVATAAVLERRVAGEKVAPPVAGDLVVGGRLLEALEQAGRSAVVAVPGPRLLGARIGIEDEADVVAVAAHDVDEGDVPVGALELPQQLEMAAVLGALGVGGTHDRVELGGVDRAREQPRAVGEPCPQALQQGARRLAVEVGADAPGHQHDGEEVAQEELRADRSSRQGASAVERRRSAYQQGPARAPRAAPLRDRS